MNPERGVYLSLAASVIALLIAFWAAWEARGAMNRSDAAAARLDPIETLRRDQGTRMEALQAQVHELAQRLDELDQAPPPSNQPPAE